MELQNLFSTDSDFLAAFAESRIGGRKENQDSYGCKKTKYGYLFTVCDGMGGGPGGKTASSIAVEEIIDGIANAENDEAVANIIIKAIRRANMAIIEKGNDDQALRGMGSTATVLLISEHSAFVAHVGDSRIYQIRGHRKVFRTFDHSLVFEMVSQKVITEEQARLSAQSTVITRALGVKPDLEVDIAEVPYEKGDRFCLCTDGIHGSMPEMELIKMLANRTGTLGAITDDIATHVDNIGRATGGGHDNLTLAVIEMRTNSKLKGKMSKPIKAVLGGLFVVVLISVLLNIMQCTNNVEIKKSNMSAADSIGKLKTENVELRKKLNVVDSIAKAKGNTLNEIINVLNNKNK